MFHPKFLQLWGMASHRRIDVHWDDLLSLFETSRFDAACEWFGLGWTVVLSLLVHVLRHPCWDDLFF